MRTWDTLRHQTRTFEDLIAEIEEYELSRPFASIYTWFGATVTVDGETHTDVGVRKKGFMRRGHLLGRVRQPAVTAYGAGCDRIDAAPAFGLWAVGQGWAPNQASWSCW